MVVSEIGEQWSPQTAPAIQAETQITPMGLPNGNTARVIGIRIPKVPQDVPVEAAGGTLHHRFHELFRAQGIGHCL